MRPLKHQPISISYHLFIRNSIFYYRSNVPVDLQQYFPTNEIKRSFKTKDLKMAKSMAIGIEYKLQRTYSMIRSGMLPVQIIQGMVAELYPRKQVEKTRGVDLAWLVSEYVKVHESKWTYKTNLEVKGCLRLILDVVGNIELKTINRQTVLDLRSDLMKLPPNMYKIFADKPVKEILKLPDVRPMSIISVNKHIMRLNALLSYAVKEGIIAVNYAQGMMLIDNRKTDELRKVYSFKDLKLIVNNLPREQEKPERFWIPMIAMYAGMRLDEISQLYVEDVQQIDGVWCFNVNDEKDKKLKNLASKRVVPIHPVLIASGLLPYVESVQKSGDQRLWMNLSWRKADGYGNAIGNWYRRFNREYITQDECKVFHSFRHTVTDTLKQAGVAEAVIAELVGHSTSGSMTMGRYGKRYQPKVLLEALLHIDYSL